MMGKLSQKTHRKFEKAANMKFVDILHKGCWGNYAECASENGDVFGVNKKTGETKRLSDLHYKNGTFFVSSGQSKSALREIAR